jgi:hypothetical protein
LPYHDCASVPSIEADVPAELGLVYQLKAFDGERLVVQADLTRVYASPDDDGDGLVKITFGVLHDVIPQFRRDTRLELELSQDGRLVARGVYECAASAG